MHGSTSMAPPLSRALLSHADWRQPGVPSLSLDWRSSSVDNPFAAGPAPALDRASWRGGLVPPPDGTGRVPVAMRSPSAPSALLSEAARTSPSEAAAGATHEQVEPHAQSHSDGDGGVPRAASGGAAAQGAATRGTSSTGPGTAEGPARPPRRADAASLGEPAAACQEAQEQPPGDDGHIEAAAPQLLHPLTEQHQQPAPPQEPNQAQAHEQALAASQLERPAQLPPPPPSGLSSAPEHEALHAAPDAAAEAASAEGGKAAEQPALQAARGSPRPAASDRGEPGGPSRPLRPEGGEAAGRGPLQGTERRPSSKAERRELQERQKAAKEAVRKVHQPFRFMTHMDVKSSVDGSK